MNKILKTITIVSISLFSIYSYGQNKCEHAKRGHHNPEVLLKKLDAQLNLNETQEKRVLTLLEHRLEQRQALKKEVKTYKKGKHVELEKTMQSVLTEEQFEKYKTLKSEHKSNKQKSDCKKSSCDKANFKSHANKGPKGRLEYLSKVLELTPAQKAELKAHHDKKREEFHKNHPEFKEARTKLRADFTKDMKAILTPEQFKKFNTLKEQHHKRKQHFIKD